MAEMMDLVSSSNCRTHVLSHQWHCLQSNPAIQQSSGFHVETDECTSGASVVELEGMNTSTQGEQTRRHARIQARPCILNVYII